MTIYLTIITTALVLTQIIRLVQNAVQLKRIDKVELRNKQIERVYAKWEEWLDRQGEHETEWDISDLTDSESTQAGAIRSARGDGE